MRIALVCSLLTLCCASPALADVQERYAELQSIPEAINDPDPLMRLAQLEAILAGGDATKVQLALRTAFTVDDPNVRALALRAHLASYKTMILTARIPDEIKIKLDDPETKRFRDMASFIGGLGNQFVIEIVSNSIQGLEFPIRSVNNYAENFKKELAGSGNVRGSTISLRVPFRIGNNVKSCSFELHNYDGFIVSGTGACDENDGSFPFPVSMRLF